MTETVIDTSKCVCSGPGFCPLYGREVPQGQYELCACKSPNPAFNETKKCEERRRRWLAQYRGEKVPEITAAPPERYNAATQRLASQPSMIPAFKPWETQKGPGTKLHFLLKKMGLHPPEEGCQSCAVLCAEMNELGYEGCKAQRELILAQLRPKAASLGWGQTLIAGIKAFSLVFSNPRDPIGAVLDEAIRQAEEESSQEAKPP